jgi:hypothetical protein
MPRHPPDVTLLRLADVPLGTRPRCAWVADHVVSCLRCRAVVRNMAAAFDALRAAGRGPPNAVRSRRLLRRILRSARGTVAPINVDPGTPRPACDK